MVHRPLYPPGFRFIPTDVDLILTYLKKKLNKEAIPDVCIFDVDLYKFNPWELTTMYPTLGKDAWYFFTSRQRRYLHGSRPDRAAGDGYWKATSCQPIRHNNDQKVGYKRSLVFYKGKGSVAKKTDWIMHEYMLLDSPTTITHNNDMRLDECVLCRISEHKLRPRREHDHDKNLQMQPMMNINEHDILEDQDNMNLGQDIDHMGCKYLLGSVAINSYSVDGAVPDIQGQQHHVEQIVQSNDAQHDDMSSLGDIGSFLVDNFY